MEFVQHPMKLFGLPGSEAYAKQICSHLDGVKLTPIYERDFEDGECYVKPPSGLEGNVRGHNVFIICSLYADDKLSVSDRFMRLCMFVGACRGASAHQVIPVIPHLAWARQDRKTASRAPVMTKIVATILESVGIDRALFMDVHSKAAEDNAFSLRTPMDNLESRPLLAKWCASRLRKSKKIVIYSPDSGGTKRAEAFRETLIKKMGRKDIGIAFFDKLRHEQDGGVSGTHIGGDVEDADVVMVNDMISTAGTAVLAGNAVKEHGGRLHSILATHGLFVGRANEALHKLDPKVVVVTTDTIPAFRLDAENRKKHRVVPTTDLMAKAIRRINSGTGSISELIED